MNFNIKPKITPLLITMVFFCYNTLFSQYFFSGDLNGFLILEDNQIIPYEIHFECSSNNCIGISISDKGGENETKSNLTGFLDFNRETIDFKENGIVYTKADYSTFDEFCYVNFSLKINFKNKKITFEEEGDFVGKFKDSSVCAKGRFKLINILKLEKKINKLQKRFNSKLVKKSFGDSVSQVINKKLDSLSSNLNKNKSNSIYELTLNLEKTHELYLQDVGNQDGDVIQISSDNYKKNISLTKELYKLKIGSISRLKIIGIDEGESPTIPLNIVIKDYLKNKVVKKNLLFLKKKDTFNINLSIKK